MSKKKKFLKTQEYFKPNDNANTEFHNLWNAAKSELRYISVYLNAFAKNEEGLKTMLAVSTLRCQKMIKKLSSKSVEGKNKYKNINQENRKQTLRKIKNANCWLSEHYLN